MKVIGRRAAQLMTYLFEFRRVAKATNKSLCVWECVCVSQALQACMGELFQARLGGFSPSEEASSWDSLSYSSPLLERLQRPSRILLSQDVGTQ